MLGIHDSNRIEMKKKYIYFVFLSFETAVISIKNSDL